MSAQGFQENYGLFRVNVVATMDRGICQYAAVFKLNLIRIWTRWMDLRKSWLIFQADNIMPLSSS